MRVGIMPNFKIANITETAQLLCEKLQVAGLEAVVLPEQDKADLSNIDMLISIGGDGTYLHTARVAVKHQIPILGMNMGRLGFLTQFDFDGMDQAVQLLTQGNYTIEERLLLDVTVYQNDAVRFQDYALNDLVVFRANPRLLDLEIHVGEQVASTVYGDGLIVATPTGSTAYSLSAGGPIVEPESHVMVITPICPHSMSSRPMVISDKKEIRIKMKPNREDAAQINIDGGETLELEEQDEVVVKKSLQTAKVVRFYQTDFYKVLREKFS